MDDYCQMYFLQNARSRRNFEARVNYFFCFCMLYTTTKCYHNCNVSKRISHSLVPEVFQSCLSMLNNVVGFKNFNRYVIRICSYHSKYFFCKLGCVIFDHALLSQEYLWIEKRPK